MTRSVCAAIVGICVMVVSGPPAWATPSSTVWTPCTIDFQTPGMTHVGIDDYFTVGRKGSDAGSFPTDLTLFEWGMKLGKKLQIEYGIDVLEPTDDPLFGNAKIGYPEGKLSPHAPALELGFFNFGTKSGVTNQNVVYLLTGKTLPNGKTRLAAAYYLGNSSVLRSSAGEEENTGFMVAVDHQLIPGRVVLAADYASGKNAIGGGGAGVYYYFTPNISLLAGPVWFNDKEINGGMKWTTQLDINF
jgi:hypothetical protein